MGRQFSAKINLLFTPPSSKQETSRYFRSGFTATAMFAGIVQGVVVQIKIYVFSSSSPKIEDFSLISGKRT